MATGGKWIQQVRAELGLKAAELVRRAEEFAQHAGNKQFRIDRNRLLRLENKGMIPNIYTSVTIAACLERDPGEVLAAYRAHAEEAREFFTHDRPLPGQEQGRNGAEIGRALARFFTPERDADDTILIPPSHEAMVLVRDIVAAMFHKKGGGSEARGKQEAERYLLAWIGWKDERMWPLLRPGSLVLYDTSETTIVTRKCPLLQDRALYVLWLSTNVHTCAWCNVQGSHVVVWAHPQSEAPILFLKASELTVLGRVVHVWPPVGATYLRAS